MARQYSPTGYFLLCYNGYPFLHTPVCLITPYKEPLNGQVQEHFNYYHSKGCSIIERAFGKSTLFRAIEVKHTFAPLVIASCAFLHNVCIENEGMLEQDVDVA